MSTIDQMLAQAALEESNLKLGFRSDALVTYEDAQRKLEAACVQPDDEVDAEFLTMLEDHIAQKGTL